MIRTLETDGRLALAADLPRGHVAYVDSDWVLGSRFDAIPAVVVGGGTIQRSGGPSWPLPDGVDEDAAAALSLFAVAREAVAACGEIASSPVAVEGNGAIAGAIRMLLDDKRVGSARQGDDNPPEAIVDCTGSPGAVAAATRRLADGGTLVLAGEPLGRPLDIDLYPDVHSRCLRVAGVARPLAGSGRELDAGGLDGRLLEQFRRTLAGASSGVPLPPGAGWYRLPG